MVCAWIEANLVHGEGDKFGEPFKLEPWQRAFVYRLNEYDPASGRRLVRRALLGMPKGNGKTELLAAIALSELAGPYAPKSPNIPIAAASYEQADLLFGTARVMLTQGPLAQFFEVYETEILRKDGPGRMYRVAAVAGTNDGARPTCLVADELHEWTGSKERVHLVLSNSLAKRSEALELNISTAGSDEASLLGRMLSYGKKIASGEVTDPAFLIEWWQAPDSMPLETDEEVRAAIISSNPSAPAQPGDRGFVDVDRLVARYNEVPKHEFERYHLNRFTQAPDRWIGSDVWAKLAKPDRGLPPDGSKVWLGFDGSYSRDASVICGATGDGYIFLIRAWEKDQRDPDWTVPRDEVDAVVASSMARWDAQLWCDPPGWVAEIQRWQEEYGERVLVFPTAVPDRMGPACDRFYTKVQTGELSHDGSPLLARHIANVHTRETRHGTTIGKANKSSPHRIDAAVAAVVAAEAAHHGAIEPDEVTLEFI